MPGSTGTGYPLTLRCAKCKVRRSDRDHECGTHLAATGRTRPIPSSQFGRGHPRALQYQAEYRCLDCGHVGWSRHRTMEDLLRKTDPAKLEIS